jgi:hypothetical protein
MTIDGGRLCGGVRDRIDAPPIAARTFWCRLRQYIGAGSATVNVAFPAHAVAVTGETAEFVSRARTAARACAGASAPDAGCASSMTPSPRPQLTYVRAGTLRDREIARPEAMIWTAAAPSSACIAADLPRYEGQPPPAG